MLNSLKSYHYVKNSIFFLLVMVSCALHAQSDKLFEAQKLSQDKKFDEAISIIDQVVLHPETSNDPAAWHIRSYSYLQFYKLQGVGNTSKINLLDTAMSSALKSVNLDKDKEYYDNNIAFIRNGAGLYYKICSILLMDSLDNEKSEDYYLKYKKYTSIISPDFDLKSKDVEFYNTMGSLFADLYTKNNFNQKYGDIAKTALLKVLDVDNKNIKANINLGILYYNQGATLMRMMDYDVDLAQLDVIQENAKKLFKQSLPFMIKVYELDPKAEKALESLQGIYSALLDEEKANEFKLKKEALEKK